MLKSTLRSLLLVTAGVLSLSGMVAAAQDGATQMELVPIRRAPRVTPQIPATHALFVNADGETVRMAIRRAPRVRQEPAATHAWTTNASGRRVLVPIRRAPRVPYQAPATHAWAPKAH